MNLSNLLFYKPATPISYLPKRKACGPLFDSPEVNRLIDAHHEAVERGRFEKLVIPKELHGIEAGFLSENDKYVADKLSKNGFHSHLCGGTARDLILHDTVNDFDFVTDASNEDLRRIFGNIRFHVIPSGHEFGYIDFGNEVVDVCTMVNTPADLLRNKSVSGYDPSKLYSSSLLFDALQRDITFNSLYYDTESEDLIDWVGGLYDLREGIISTSVPARDEICHNPRIVLRALRFKARFGFQLSEELETAIRTHGADLMPKVSPHSIKSNLPGFFSAGYTYTGTCLLLEYGLFGAFFPMLGADADVPAYQEYVKRTAVAVDWIFDEGAIGLPLLAMSAFLWPVVRKLEKECVDHAAERVLESERKIIELNDEEAAFMLAALRIEYTKDRRFIRYLLEKTFGKPTLEDALEVLRIHYWTHPFEL